MTTKTTYTNLLNSIIARASDALHHQGHGQIGDMVVAINDVESDLNTLLAHLNKDETVIAALEADARRL